MHIEDRGDKTATCWFPHDDWDSPAQLEKHMEWLIQGKNDSLADDIDRAAEEQGLYIDWDRKPLNYDVNEDPAWIDFWLQTPNTVKAKKLGLL